MALGGFPADPRLPSTVLIMSGGGDQAGARAQMTRLEQAEGRWIDRWISRWILLWITLWISPPRLFGGTPRRWACGPNVNGGPICSATGHAAFHVKQSRLLNRDVIHANHYFLNPPPTVKFPPIYAGFSRLLQDGMMPAAVNPQLLTAYRTSALMREMDCPSCRVAGAPNGPVRNPSQSVDNYVHNICGETCA